MSSNMQVSPIIFRGGLDLATPMLELPSGACTQLHNYEVSTLGRYTRIEGYERFDGQASPSKTASVIDPLKTDTENLDQWVINREAQRALIQVVPGSGRILGVAYYKGSLYAFRNSADGSRCDLHKSTSAGWEFVKTPLLRPNGKFEFRVANFTGDLTRTELVGVDGVNKAFRYNGNSFLQIDTGMEILGYFPEHLEVTPSQILFLSYGSSLMYSGVGDPTKWVGADGGEIAVGDRIVGLDVQANNSLAVFCRNTTYVLYGKTDLSWELTALSPETGAIEWATQSIGDSIYLDDRGITRLNRVQSFGNFDMATISQAIEPLLKRYINRVTASFVIKEKNQYRLCFDDGSGVVLTFQGAEVSGFSTFDLSKIIRCTVSSEDSAGKEIIFFGSDDGYVYQAESGLSFDGAPYACAMRPAFSNFNMPEHKKDFRKAVLEVDTPSSASLSITPDFDYSDPNVPVHATTNVIATGGGGYYDEAIWDETQWSTSSVFTTDMYLDGVARNISMAIYSESDREPPHSITSMIIHWKPKNRRR